MIDLNNVEQNFFCNTISAGRKSKSGFANTVFNTDFCQIVFGFGLYLRFQNQIVFGFGLYLQRVYLYLDCIYVRNSLKYLDLDFIYGLYMYLDLLVVDLCPSLNTIVVKFRASCKYSCVEILENLQF